MAGPTYFTGVDFSGAKGPLRNLWSAIGIERQGRLHILDLQPHPFRADLGEFLLGRWRQPLGASSGERMLCGLDFPLGLPIDAARAVVDQPLHWRAINRWLAERSPDQVTDALESYRKTPRACDRGQALSPLDLRVFKQTVAGARWLHELNDGANNPADGPGSAGLSILPHAPQAEAELTLIEVYPSITRTDLGIKAGRKPSRPGEIRTRSASLGSWLSFDHPSIEATAMTIEDAWDATLACLSVYLVRDDLDQPDRVGRIPPEAVRLEGWIYRHPEAG